MSLGGFWPVFKRELFSLFITPLAWVLVLVFLLVQGMHFALLVDNFSVQQVQSDQTPMQAFFGNTVLLYLVLFLLVPPLTMRTFAEERRSGTIEPLLTAPLSPLALVLAKYASALVAYVAMWAPTGFYVVILRRTGDLDGNVVLASYLGVFAVGAGYIALGLFMSSLTKSQFLAVVLTALVILVLFIVGIGEFVAREGTLAHQICSHVSVWAHMNDFASGIIDSRRLVFYGSLTLTSLFATTRVVQSWRWG
jgi:ABC-2 type transport system permease protein